MTFKVLITIFIALILSSCEKLFFQDNTTDDPVRNFDVFWKEFDLNYSYFDYKGVDWDSIYTIYRSKVNKNTSNIDLFNILWEMTNHLKDAHVNITSSFSHSRFNYHDSKSPTINWIGDLELNTYLDNIKYPNSTLKYARIKNKNIGYLRISSFGNSFSEYSYVDNVIKELEATDAIIVDLRMNGGGSDSNGKEIVSRFTDKKRLYRKIRYRNGPNHNDFSDWQDDYIEPSGNQYLNITIILTNEYCFSSTEDCVLAFQVLPNTIIIGDTTGGGSGNPVQRELPNGWLYRLSNWQVVNNQMVYYEGIGIAPDSLVWISKQDSINGIDRILETAIYVIEKQQLTIANTQYSKKR